MSWSTVMEQSDLRGDINQSCYGGAMVPDQELPMQIIEFTEADIVRSGWVLQWIKHSERQNMARSLHLHRAG